MSEQAAASSMVFTSHRGMICGTGVRSPTAFGEAPSWPTCAT